MGDYKLTNDAREDLIRIHQYGVRKFGMKQADRYFHLFFEYFQRIAENPFQYESADHIRTGYRRCVCGLDSIYYRITQDRVEIISIIGRQDIEQLKAKSGCQAAADLPRQCRGRTPFAIKTNLI